MLLSLGKQHAHVMAQCEGSGAHFPAPVCRVLPLSLMCCGPGAETRPIQLEFQHLFSLNGWIFARSFQMPDKVDFAKCTK